MHANAYENWGVTNDESYDSLCKCILLKWAHFLHLNRIEQLWGWLPFMLKQHVLF